MKRNWIKRPIVWDQGLASAHHVRLIKKFLQRQAVRRMRRANHQGLEPEIISAKSEWYY